MWCEALPEILVGSNTSMIPKVADPKGPGDYRPIAVTSVLVRCFHRILANRLSSFEFDNRQRAFRKTDGCTDNTVLVDFIQRYHHTKYRKMFLANLDMAKAFDSVSLDSIKTTMCFAGLPKQMIRYINSIYTSGYTVIQHGDWI